MNENVETANTEAPPSVVTDGLLPYHHTWVDGSVLDDRLLHLLPMSDELTRQWLSGVRLIADYDRDGEVTINVPDAEEGLGAVFDQVCADGRDLPLEEKAVILSRTLLSIETKRPFFRRGDPRAPQGPRIVIYVTYWHPDGERRGQFFFRKVTAEDSRGWSAITNKAKIERDGQGRAVSGVTSPNVPAIRDALLGNEMKRKVALFIEATGYDGPAPFLHIYRAAQQLFAPVDIKQACEEIKVAEAATATGATE